MHTIAVSACLLGVPCRYDGGSKPNEEVIRFLERHECEVIRICPEVMGGLSIPHPANEIQVREGKRVVCDIEGARARKAALTLFSKQRVLLAGWGRYTMEPFLELLFQEME